MKRTPTSWTLLTGLTAMTLLGVACGGGGKSEVDFAAVLPLSGDYAVYGEAIRKGAELALEQSTQDPDLNFALTLSVEDSGGDPAKAAELASRLYDSALAIVGGVTSDEAVAMAAVARDEDRVLLSPSASSTALSGIAPGNFYRIFPTASDEAVKMANFAEETLNVSEVVLIAETNEFGQTMAAAWREAFEAEEGEIIAELTFDPGQMDLSSVIAEVMASEIKTVLVAASGPGLARAVQSLRDGGFAGQGYRILTSSAIASKQVLEMAGDAAWGIYYTQTALDLNSDEEPIKGFREAYQAKYGETPDAYAAYGYDAFQVLVQALREQEDNGGGGSVLPSQIEKGMRAINNYRAVTGTIQFRESGDVQQFERVYYIAEGQPVDFDEWWRNRQEEMREKLEENRKKLERLMRDQSQ